MGDSSPSLLPQPAQLAPIQPMSGGGPTESLLPRPPVDVPVIPMSGGGPEDSVLPQPAVATRITPMSGGGSYPVMKLRGYKPGKLEEDYQKLKKEEKLMRVQNSTSYKNRRQEIWGDGFPETHDASKIAKLHHVIKTDEPIRIFYVYDFSRFLKILRILRKDEESENIYILLNKTNSPEEFSKVYKKFIDFVKDSETQAFFLYDKSQTINTLNWDLTKERRAQEEIFFAEPTSVGIEFKKGDKPMQLIFTAYPTPPNEVKDNFIGLTSAETTKHLDFQKAKDWEEVVPRLEENTLYSVNDTKRVYFNANLIEIAYSDKPLDEPGPATAPVKGVEPTTSTPAVKSPPTTPVQAQAPVVKPGVQQYIVQKKNTVPLKIGSVDFELRKPTIDTQAAWDKGEFDENESKFFTELGFNEKLVATPRGAALAAKKGNFLKSLTISSCFKQNQFLVKHECESAQDFLQELLEVRQIQRLEQMRESLGSVQNYAIQIRKSREEKAAAAAKAAEAAEAAKAAAATVAVTTKQETKEEKARREETEALLDSLVSSIKEKNKLNITPRFEYGLFIDIYISFKIDSRLVGLTGSNSEYAKVKIEPDLSTVNWKTIQEDYIIIVGGGASYYAANIKEKYDVIKNVVWLDKLEDIVVASIKVTAEANASYQLLAKDYNKSVKDYNKLVDDLRTNKSLYKIYKEKKNLIKEKKKLYKSYQKIFIVAFEMANLIVGQPPLKAVKFYKETFDSALTKMYNARKNGDTITQAAEYKHAEETRDLIRRIGDNAETDSTVSVADKAEIKAIVKTLP